MVVQSEILTNLKRLIRLLCGRGEDGGGHEELQEEFRRRYRHFQELLDSNAELLKIVADMEVKLRGEQLFGMSHIRAQATRAVFHALRMVASYENLSGKPEPVLRAKLAELQQQIKDELEDRAATHGQALVLGYEEISRDMVDQVGGKSANLGEVRNRVGLPTPRGFAITTTAFTEFFANAGLREEIKRIKLGIAPDAPASLDAASEEIQRLIITAPLPTALEQAIVEAHDALAKECGRHPDECPVAMRSSAIGEDSEYSFAGQYLSVLNVPRRRLVTTYRYVVASLYTARAMSYRLLKGIVDEDMSMSVACLEMIESVASGVMYTRHPYHPQDDRVLINAVWGLGVYAVDGVVIPDSVSLLRETLEPQELRVAEKPVMLTCGAGGVLVERPVPPERRDAPCLNAEQLRQLGGYGLRLEEHYGAAQDVEWALTPGERLLILQSRPLGVVAGETSIPAGLPSVNDREPVLAGGETAQPGIGSGPAFVVTDEDSLDGFPDGGVLVAPHSSPKFMVLMRKAQAILTDSGSITGHMASLAREFGVPAILGLKSATQDITTGEILTVDAYSRRVYPGQVDALMAFKAPRTAHMRDTPVHGVLSRVARHIIPLNLVNPKAEEFRPKGCRTVHDVMRLLHERCYGEMFALSDMASARPGMAMRLKAQTGLDLHVIDLGGGVATGAAARGGLDPSDVVGAPFKALLNGLTLDQAQLSTPRPLQMKGFLSVMSQQVVAGPAQAGERFGDKSYAIISDKYVNFSSRVGYHYGVLDCYCGSTVSKNYITFSFKGGAADDLKRARRARAIGRILEANGFRVEVEGDRVVGRLQKRETDVVLEKLWIVGKLLQFTRQMDMLMVDEASVDAMAACFLSGRYVLDASCPIPQRPAPKVDAGKED
ncbi:phosphoenolpyruvate synthase [Humidesulfovibrio mexicanus]|uniref:Phosphoenolpyruvate synthase n=1 Tax=Humidesulfovibrio mexicanus TaxID=147047 RepID=A0A239B256_9BACT|nr:PEP/pyruvate-binding domain-containing protein [Humidesulfovibrio mexicanus]SNS01283.1 phosphoenolpyruvate synthase [Humidesulfovibrio mexicanus]